MKNMLSLLILLAPFQLYAADQLIKKTSKSSLSWPNLPSPSSRHTPFEDEEVLDEFGLDTNPKQLIRHHRCELEDVAWVRTCFNQLSRNSTTCIAQLQRSIDESCKKPVDQTKKAIRARSQDRKKTLSQAKKCLPNIYEEFTDQLDLLSVMMAIINRAYPAKK